MSRNKKSFEKERNYAVEMRFSEKTKITSVKVDKGMISMMTDNIEVKPGSSAYIKFYEKGNGKEKKTLRIPLKSPNLYITEVLENTNLIIAVDTNVKNGKSASVAAVFLVLKTHDSYEINFIKGYYNVFENKTGLHSEVIAMDCLFKNIKAGVIACVLENDNVLVVTDHNLGKIEQFNRRELPLIDGDDTSYLPDNVNLVYASTDTKHDSVFNEMLAECDRCATELLKLKW